MIRSESLSDLLDLIKDYRADIEGNADTRTCSCHNIEDLNNRSIDQFSEQERVLQQIQEVIDSRQRKVILIQAPTGFGKSWVALALAMKYGASILTSTVDLQEQYQKEFDFLTTVKGKTRYPCKQFHEQKTCDKGYCSGCKYEEQPPYDASIDPKQEEERRSDPKIKEKFIHTDKDKHQREGTGIECYYYDAKKKGVLASSAVYSYASYLSPLKENPDKFPKREVLICDEAHDYDHYVSRLFEVTLDNEKAIELIDELRGETFDSDKHWDPKTVDSALIFPAEDNQPEILVDMDGTLMLTPDSTHHPEPFTPEEKIRHAWHFIRVLIQEFEAKKDNYEKCARHSKYLLGKEHLKKHPELFCHKPGSQGKEHGFTINRNCKGKQDPNTNHIQMVGHQKNCTAHRAYIRDNWYLDCKQHLEEACDRDHRIYNHENYVKMKNYILDLKTLDKALSEADAEVDEEGNPKPSGLVGDKPEYGVISSAPEIRIGPIITRWITTKLVNAHNTCSVFLSSTIDKDLFCRETRIQERFVEYIKLDSLIPVQHRRVILDKQRHRGYDGNWLLDRDKLAKRQVWYGLLGVIHEVLEEHPEERGILMLTSYLQMDRIREMIEECDDFGDLLYPDLLNRFTFDGEGAEFEKTKKKHLDQHYHEDGTPERNRYDPDATHYDPRLPICREEDCEKENKINTTNSVIVTVKATTGVNLPYDESRFQIILKAPYVREVMEGVDFRAEIIKETDPDRYWLKSAFRLVQYCGRSVRHIDDRAVTYALDGSVKYMIKNNREHLPKWFLDAYEEGWAGSMERMN